MNYFSSLTTIQVAERLGVSSRRVLALAKDRRLKGEWVHPRWYWTPGQVEAMVPRERGAAGHLRRLLILELQRELDSLKALNHADRPIKPSD